MANSNEKDRNRARDRELGMIRDITRRDFLNGMAIGAGGVLANGWLPGMLAAQTVLGGAKMVVETGQHPSVLKDMVTSPGGTTVEGLHELEKGKLRATLISAVRAATDKSRKLGQG